MKRAKEYCDAENVYFGPEIRLCPHCSSALVRGHNAWQKYIFRLGALYWVTSYAYRCSNPNCSYPNATYRSAQAETLGLKHRSYGTDVLAAIGFWRFSCHSNIREIKTHLERLGVQMSIKEVYILVRLYLQLINSRPLLDEDFMKKVEKNGGIILAIDGVQPEKGNETLFILMDALTGKVLCAENLLSAASEDVKPLIQRVKDLGLPILAVISDHQSPIRIAVEKVLPGTPHQFCHFHLLRNAAAPIADADRELCKNMKRKIRGVKSVEKAASSLPESDEKRVILSLCFALRTALLISGFYPLEAGGLKLYETLQGISGVIGRCLDVRQNSLMRRLHRLSLVWEEFSEDYQRIRKMYEQIWKLAKILDLDTPSRSIKIRVGKYLAKLRRLAMKDAEVRDAYLNIIKNVKAQWRGLFFCYDDARIPRTNNSLESFIGFMKANFRRITGRKNWQGYLIRYGRYIAFVDFLWVREDIESIIVQVPYGMFNRNWRIFLDEDERFKKRYRIRKDLHSFLAVQEQVWCSIP